MQIEELINLAVDDQKHRMVILPADANRWVNYMRWSAKGMGCIPLTGVNINGEIAIGFSMNCLPDLEHPLRPGDTFGFVIKKKALREIIESLQRLLDAAENE